jgi:hypothetical protein
MSDENGLPIEILLHGGAVASVSFNSVVSQQFRCSESCSGVAVSAPDVSGNRTVSFTGTVLHEVQSFPLPGERTATLSSEPLLFPPVTP